MDRLEISESEILEELQKVVEGGAGPDDAYTTRELADAVGCSQHVARKRVRKLVMDGTVEAIRVRRPRMDGLMTEVPAYRLVEAQAA